MKMLSKTITIGHLIFAIFRLILGGDGVRAVLNRQLDKKKHPVQPLSERTEVYHTFMEEFEKFKNLRV